MRELRWADLLTLPWKEGGEDERQGLDCLGVLRTLYARAGFAVDALELSRAWTPASAGEPWERVGGLEAPATSIQADRLLDVLASVGTEGFHVSVLVELRNRIVLTSTKPHGVHALPARRVQGLIGVYRLAAGLLLPGSPVPLGSVSSSGRPHPLAPESRS